MHPHRRCRHSREQFCVLILSVLTLWSQPHQSEAFQQPHHSGLLASPSRIRPLLGGETPTTHSYQSTSLFVLKEPTQQFTTNNRELERRIVDLGRRGKTEEALALYYETSNPTVRLMNSAMDACARARPTRLEQAFRLLEEAPASNIVPNVFTFGALMSACARARRGDKARALLKTMQDKYAVTPNAVVYSSAITAVARTNPPQPQVALALLKEATQQHDLVMNVVGYNAAISACARAGDWQRATALLREMESNATIANPDHVTYGTVLSACENGGQWDLVLDYARAMEQHDDDMQLDVLALTSVLKACQQLGLAKETLYYINQTPKPQHHRKTMGWKRQGAKQPLHKVDAVAYRLAISACARGGAWQDGIRLLEDFEKATGEKPDVMAYTAAITGCEYAGEWRRAFGLLDTMRQNGVEPNEVTFTSVIGACATACRVQEQGDDNNNLAFPTSTMPLPQHKALQLLNVLKADDTVVNPNINVYNAAIRVCAEACDLKRALLLMKDLQEQPQGLEPTIVTFGTLMTAAERVESIEGTNSVFRAMKRHDVEPNEIIYGAAISCCRKAGQAERAFLLLRKMIRDGLSPNTATFNTAIMAQVEGGARQPPNIIDACMDRAITIYKILMAANNDNSNKSNNSGGKYVARPNRQTYNLLIRALATNKKPLEAEALLKKMGEAGYVPDVDLYAATVTAYERTGQPLKALQLMESMREDGYDFYDIEVLNAAFKKAVKLVNVVGRGFTSSTSTGGEAAIGSLADDKDEENEEQDHN